MYPERLPADVDSGAERRLFEQFRTEFSDDFVVFSQVRWLARLRRDGAEDGEADFVVAHHRYGALVLEVKGGGVEKNAQTGEWKSVDSKGREHTIRDPIKQAGRSMFALRNKLRDAEATRRFEIPLTYAVAFPDVRIEDDLGVDAPKEIVIDQERARNLRQAVIDVFRFRDGTPDEPGEEAIEALISVLGKSWRVETTTGTDIERREREIRLMTEQQYQLLDMLGTRRRALITGCAGSGKTMMAIEKARRLAHEGYRVLLTCFNKNLAQWMAAQLEGEGVETRHFQSVCARLAEKAGVELTKGENESDQDFFARFPDALLAASEALPDNRFDAIIVDEGQDFEETWWVALMSLLEHPDDSVLYIFYDDNQRIYTRHAEFPIQDEPFKLTRSCRNTKQIHDAVMLFYDSGSPPESIGPDGETVKQIVVPERGSERAEVERYIDELVTEQHVRPEDIALLTRKNRERSAWKHPPSRGSWAATWELAEARGKVLVSTIHSFKGLERPVVVVCELEEVDLHEDAELLYVAFSRARAHLAVAGLRLQE
jgi:ATP:corrinoid adenosyltransferase